MQLLRGCRGVAARSEGGGWHARGREEGGYEGEEDDVDVGVVTEGVETVDGGVLCLTVIDGYVVARSGIEGVGRECWSWE